MTSFILQLVKQQPRRRGVSQKYIAISTKHISSPTSDKYFRQITLKCRHNTTVPHCTVLMKLTVAVLHFIRLLFYIPRQLSTSNISSIFPMQPLTRQIVILKNAFRWNLATKITSSVNWLPLYDHFPPVSLPLQNPG